MQKLKLAALALPLIVACSQSASEESDLTVNLHLSEVMDTDVRMVLNTDSGLVPLDSGKLVNGELTLSAHLENPTAVFIKLDAIRRPLFIFADNDTYEINGSSVNDGVSFTVANGRFSEDVNSYNTIQEEFNTEAQALNSEYQRAAQASDSLTIISLTERFEQVMNGKNRKVTELAKSSGAFGAFVAMQELYDAEWATLDSVYVNIPVKDGESPIVQKLKERIGILKRVAIGEPYLDITQNDTLGNPISLSDNLGRYTLVDFWASWCGPCRQENPNVVAAFNKYKDRGFQVVGVSLDEHPDRWKAAIVSDELNWPQMSDLQGWQNAGSAKYGIRAIPQNIMIDENGIIVAKNLREDELHTWLENNL